MQNRPKTQLKGILMLLLTAFVWGSSFVAQSVGMDSVEAFTFNGIRTLVGALVLLPVVLLGHSRRKAMDPDGEKNKIKNTFGAAISVCPVFFIATTLQQYAFYYSSSGKIAFITAFYMFFVALMGLFLGKKLSGVTCGCVLVALGGMYFLCFPAGGGFGALNRGDIYALLGALFFALHILCIERWADRCDGVFLSCLQFAFCGVLSIILMFILETPRISLILDAAIPILYAGAFSCGIAYTLQIVGQKYCEATIASLLMCLESVFGVLTSAVILREFLSRREILGCLLMFAAIIVSQLAESGKFPGKQERQVK